MDLERNFMDLTVSPQYFYNAKNTSTPDISRNTEDVQEQNAFADWLSDKDKVSTDGLDDGKISAKEAGISFAKGLAGIVKTAINHPVMTGLSVLAGIGLTVATGGAALPVMAAAGAVLGGGTIAGGIYKAAVAKTDGDKKAAFEQMGNGTFALVASAFGAKKALKSASRAGVESAQNAATSNPVKNLINCFKAVPDALRTSGSNIRVNFLSLTNKPAVIKGKVISVSDVDEEIPVKLPETKALPPADSSEIKALPASKEKLALPEPEKLLALPEPEQRLALMPSKNSATLAVLDDTGVPAKYDMSNIVDIKYTYPSGVVAQSLDDVILYRNGGFAPTDVQYTYPDGVPADSIEEVLAAYGSLKETAAANGINVSDMDADMLSTYFQSYREAVIQQKQEFADLLTEVLQDRIKDAPTLSLSDLDNLGEDGKIIPNINPSAENPPIENPSAGDIPPIDGTDLNPGKK